MTYRRRQILQWGGWGSLALVAGCGQTPPRPESIMVLKQSVPVRLGQRIAQQSSTRFRLVPRDTRRAVWTELAAGTPAALCLLGGDWLDRAIRTDRLQPLPEDWLTTPWWQSLDPRWQQLTQQQGQTWGIPWRWGVTAIGYRRDRISQPITRWEDLWRPELRGRLTLPDHPREVIGLALKRLGFDWNATTELTNPALTALLAELHQQVLAYTSQDYLSMLRIADSWVAVGWSEDLYQAQQVDPEIEVVIPEEGSLIWWDTWVIPRQGSLALNQQAWLAALYQAESIAASVNYTRIPCVVPPASPLTGEEWQRRAIFDPETFQKGVFLSSLPGAAAQQVLQVWQQMRGATG